VSKLQEVDIAWRVCVDNLSIDAASLTATEVSHVRRPTTTSDNGSIDWRRLDHCLDLSWSVAAAADNMYNGLGMCLCWLAQLHFAGIGRYLLLWSRLLDRLRLNAAKSWLGELCLRLLLLHRRRG
jgi:hypothetical protein